MDASAEEQQKCRDDDTMMLRLITLFLVAEETRKAGGAVNSQEKTGLLIEHPAPPEERPEVVSWWRTEQWKRLKNTYDLSLYILDQGEMGGEAYKPTALGTNMELSFPEQKVRMGPRRRDTTGMSPEEIARQSRKLARWTPVLMSGIAEACMRVVGQPVKRRLYTWRSHVAREHTPFRKDCAVCQQGAARDRPHARQKLQPKAGVLSLDTAGPFARAPDLNLAPGSRGCTAKFIMVGTFTWPTGGVGEPLEEDVVPVPEEVADLPLGGEDETGMDEDGEGDRPVEIDPGAMAELPEEEPQDGDQPVEVGQEEQPQVQVFRMALPMMSKKQDETLRTISALYLMLRADGFVVRQIHSDRGGEFMGRRLQTWCLARDILHTFTPGADPKVNGRAERAVMEVKNRIRVMIHGAEVDTSWWPIATRNLNERWRMQRIKKPDRFPPFMSTVLIKRRWWKTGDLDPTHEKVRYLCPSWIDHGHWVLREDGTKALSRAVITGTTMPVTDEAWIGLVGEEEPHDLRRRIRGKTTMRKIAGEIVQEEVCSSPDVQGVIQDEMAAMIFDDPQVASVVMDTTAKLCAMACPEDTTADEVLQTRIVSPAEVLKSPEAWKPAIQAEVDSLFTVKEALKVLNPQEARRIMEEEDVQAVPSKVVFTVKPDPQKPQGKRKCRIVACGNYAREEEDQDYFAGGADATSLRMAICMASQYSWFGANLDIRTAFLNAPMKRPGQEMEAGMELKRVLLRPAAVLVKMGFFSPGEYWEVLKAVYGFRQSPRLWSDHRDEKMREMEVEGYILVQMESEASMWTVQHRDREVVEGIVVTYVDDILILAAQRLVRLWSKHFGKVWETTEPEWVGHEKGTRFLGMELIRGLDGTWSLHQGNYTLDLLRRNLGGDEKHWGGRQIPMSKELDAEDLLDGQPDENLDQAEKLARVREAQRIVGELIWLVTRCRPDIMYAVSRLASWSSRQPHKVIQAAPQIWKYLAQSVHEGLSFKREEGSRDLQTFTDAAFGDESHGCVVILWGGGPILWKSSKQPIQTTSTAASELVEVMEGAMMMEAVRVVLEELMQGRVRCWQYTDSSSALSIVTGDTGSWRTRHLRRRARFLRWRALKGEVILRHVPGVDMVADVGTKALSAARLLHLKGLMSMALGKSGQDRSGDEHHPARERHEGGLVLEKGKARPQGSQLGGDMLPGELRGVPTERLKLALVMAMLPRAKGDDEDREPEGWINGTTVVVTYTLMVIVGTVLVQSFVGRLWSVLRQIGGTHFGLQVGVRTGQGQASAGSSTCRRVEVSDGEDSAHSGIGADSGEVGSVEAEQFYSLESEERESEVSYFASRCGERFHASQECRGLNSVASREILKCPSCWPEPFSRTLIFCEGYGQRAHVRRDGPCTQGRAAMKVLRPCKICLAVPRPCGACTRASSSTEGLS